MCVGGSDSSNSDLIYEEETQRPLIVGRGSTDIKLVQEGTDIEGYLTPKVLSSLSQIMSGSIRISGSIR